MKEKNQTLSFAPLITLKAALIGLMQSGMLALLQALNAAEKKHKALSKIAPGSAERLKHGSKGRHERPCSPLFCLFPCLFPALPPHNYPAACGLGASLAGAEPSPALLVASCSRRRVRKCSKEGKEAGAKADEAAAPKIKGKPGRKPKAKPGEAPTRWPKITRPPSGSRYRRVVIAKPPGQLNTPNIPAGGAQSRNTSAKWLKEMLLLLAEEQTELSNLFSIC